MDATTQTNNEARGESPARVVAAWNGVEIRAVTSRGGMLFTVGNTKLAFPTIEAAMTHARTSYGGKS